MSYDLYMLSETEGFTRQVDQLEPVLSETLSAEGTTFVPSDAQAASVARVESDLVSSEVPITVGYAASGVIAVSIPFWSDDRQALEKASDRLNLFCAELGDAWFFYDPQYQATTSALAHQDIHAVFTEVLASEHRAPGLAGRLGFPARRTPRQKWLDAVVFGALALLIVYILVKT